VSGLNENHKRKILASIQYANRLLEECLQSSDGPQHPSLSECLQDLSPAQLSRVYSHIKDIRSKFVKLIEKFKIEPETPRLRRSWKIRANLAALDIALEDIYPERLLGYGEIDSATARQLTESIEEIRASIGSLTAFLSQPENG